MGDFHWNMRASLVCDTVHVPDTWGGWRIHEAQATNPDTFKSETHRKNIADMIYQAVEDLDGRIDPAWIRKIRDEITPRYLARAEFIESSLQQKNRYLRLAKQIGQMLSGNSHAREYLQFRYLRSGSWYRDVYFRRLLGAAWIRNHLSVIKNG
jgi:hypothetical protein